MPVRPLAQLIDEAGLSCIDTLKIDIEGSEYETLYAFLAASGARFRPGLIIAETSHEQPAHSLGGLLTDNGYKLLLQTGRNSIYRFD